MARTPDVFEVAEADQKELVRLVKAPSTPQILVLRASIVLLSGAGLRADRVAAELKVNLRTVYLWRKRYRQEGIAGLSDRPRSGQPTTLSEEKAKEILRLSTERIPHEATHWSVRLMARAAGVSNWHVLRVWKGAGLQPHRLKSFKISKDPAFAEKVVDVVGLYLDPPHNAMVLSVDEKTQIQALERTQPVQRLQPGLPERRTHDYTRHGTASLYAAFDIASGKVIGRVTQRHRAKEFLAFLRQIDRTTPPELDLHLILDNSSTHKTPEVKAWLADHPRFKLHFTPTSASWLNAVEQWFGLLERRSIYRGCFTSVQALRNEIRRFIAAHNERQAKPFVWTKDAKAILDAVERSKRHAISRSN